MLEDRADRVIKTDVLIIGGGAAGLRAAIEARDKGASVTLLAKGGIPSGASVMAAFIAAGMGDESERLRIILRIPCLVQLISVIRDWSGYWWKKLRQELESLKNGVCFCKGYSHITLLSAKEAIDSRIGSCGG